MRVVTLLPAATEIVAAVAPESLVGVSHECDFPAWVTALPRVTRTSVNVGASSAEIDRQVRALKADGKPVIWVDSQALEALKPDLIVTQGLCEVCAVADGEVFRVAERMASKPRVLSLNATTLEGIYADVTAVGEAVGHPEEAEEVVGGMRYKIGQLKRHAPLRSTIEARGTKHDAPRVAVVEWLDPLFLAGHWVPELISAAGGLDVGAQPGDHSHSRPWSDLLELKPDIIIVALCGFSIERARVEWATQLPPEAKAVLAQLQTRPRDHAPMRLQFIDGNQFTSRPGPRVMEGFVGMAGISTGGSGATLGASRHGALKGLHRVGTGREHPG
jgi:iron complex transport system substrate-binding protein